MSLFRTGSSSGEGRTFSDFDTGGRLTQIGLAGVVAVRSGKSLEWDGEQMRATNDPQGDRFIELVEAILA